MHDLNEPGLESSMNNQEIFYLLQVRTYALMTFVNSYAISLYPLHIFIAWSLIK
jgi:hypothetical protein